MGGVQQKIDCPKLGLWTITKPFKERKRQMKTTGIELNVYVSPCDAIRAGKAQAGKLTFTIQDHHIEELTPEQRKTLADVVRDHHRTLTVNYLDWEQIKLALDQTREAKEAKEKEAQEAKEAKEKEILETTDLKKLLRGGGDFSWELKHNTRDFSDNPAVLARLEDAKNLADKLNEEERKKEEIEQLRREEENRLHDEKVQAQKEAYAEACNTFVKLHGSGNQIERLKASVLPQTEIEDMIRDYYLPKWPRYRKIKAQEVLECNPDLYDSNDVSFGVENVKDMSSVQWEALQKLKQAIPHDLDEKIIIEKHMGYPDSQDGVDVVRYAARVEITWVGHLFSRLYAFPSAETRDYGDWLMQEIEATLELLPRESRELLLEKQLQKLANKDG